MNDEQTNTQPHHAFTIQHGVLRLALEKESGNVGNSIRPSSSLPTNLKDGSGTLESREQSLIRKSMHLLSPDQPDYEENAASTEGSKTSMSAGSADIPVVRGVRRGTLTRMKSTPILSEQLILKTGDEEVNPSPRTRRASLKDGIKKLAKEVSKMIMKKKSLPNILDYSEQEQETITPTTASNVNLRSESKDDMTEHRQRDIEVFLKTEKEKFKTIKQEPKVLVIGGRNSGKSTFLKQIKLFNTVGVTMQEKSMAKKAILSSIFHAIDRLLTILDDQKKMEALLADDLSNNSSASSGHKSFNSPGNSYRLYMHNKGASSISCFSIQLGDVKSFAVAYDPDTSGNVPLEIKVLLLVSVRDAAFIFLLEHGQTLHRLPENIGFFLRPDKLDKCLSPSYIPTSHGKRIWGYHLQVDVLMSKQDSGDCLEEVVLDVRATKFHYIDTTSIANNKKSILNSKIPLFDDVNAVVFIVSLTSFDQYTEEDASKNQMAESLVLFDQLVEQKLLVEQKSHIWLLFSRRDIFQKKAERVSLKKHFPFYTGPDFDAKSYYEFIKKMFLKQATALNRHINYRAVNNTDPESIHPAISDLQSGIQEQNFN